MNQSLAELFQNKKQQAEGSSVDWDDRRDKYLAAVGDLYDQLQKVLAEPIAQRTVTLHRRKKELTESYLGTYSVEDLILLIGEEQVRFSPRVRKIVGTSGRVDVLGERGEAILIVQVDGRWGLVQTRLPTLKVVPFDEASLAELLHSVMRE